MGESRSQRSCAPLWYGGRSGAHMILLLLATLPACVPAPGSGAGESEALAFEPVEGGWSAAIDAVGLVGRFDGGGATFFAGSTQFAVGGQGGWVEGACASIAARAPDGSCARRLERTDGAATEWWEAHNDAWEHGFDVAHGGDTLTLDVPFTGATLVPSGNHVTVRVPGTRGFSYDSLTAWDAQGRTLPSHMEVVGQVVRLHVDTAGAVWPVHVDPLLTDVTWMDAPSAGDSFGSDMAPIGDVNGDGYPDVAFTGATKIYVYHGSAAGLTLAKTITGTTNNVSFADVNGDGYDDLLLSGSRSARYHFGSATGVSGSATATLTIGGSGETTYAYGVGDSNGDGYDDVVFTQPYEENGETDEGRIWLHLGAASGLTATASWVFESNKASAKAGFAVTHGDYNGDGLDDIAVGAPYLSKSTSYSDTYIGAVYLFDGAAGAPSSAPTTTLYGGPYQYIGYTMTSLADLDADGDDELVVPSASYLGSTDVYLGSPTGVSATAAYAVGPQAQLGYDDLTSCDINGDGIPDLALAASTSIGATGYQGTIGVWLGSVSGFGTEADDTIYGSPMGGFGPELACVDADQDGYADLFGGEPGYTEGSSSEGRVLATYGTADALVTMDTWSDSWCSSTTSYFGASVASVGDVNNDGYDDVGIGASGDKKLHIYNGSGSGLDAAASTSITSTVTYFGAQVSAHGDFDGDGYEDVLQGAPYFQTSSSTPLEGIAYVYEGSLLGTSSSSSWSAEGNQTGAYLGYAVAAGDFNGDGYDDAAVGAYAYDLGQTDEGIVFVYYGSATGLATSAAWYWDADVATAQAGRALAAGDLNGDGIDDLIVGAEGTSSYAGALYWFPGSGSGLTASPSVTVSGTQAAAYCGTTLVVLGDTNGDGFDDLAYACDQYDDGETNEGLVVVLPGSAAGPSTTPLFTWSPDQANAGAGAAVAGGDFTGDGYADLAVGVSDYDITASGEGQVWVFPGSGSGPDDSDPLTFTLWAPSQGFGSQVAIVDTDADGTGELYVGISGADYSASATNSGAVVAWTLEDTDGDGDPDYSDCAPADASLGARQPELCDGVDNDCDGDVDEPGGAGQPTWYADTDADSFGDEDAASLACTAPAGTVAVAGDCDDTSAAINPDALEMCDAADNDCDGVVDEADAVDALSWYADADGDAFGDAGATSPGCVAPAGYVGDATDCDDTDATILPGGTESCNAKDDDCDGLTDEGVTTTWYGDVDADGAGGDSLTADSCSAPAGYYAAVTDCDDGDASIHPGAPEACDTVDQDCDELVDEGVTTTFYADSDRDGYGDVSLTAAACAAPAGYVVNASDCDDAVSAVSPAAIEYCNGIDDECDGVIDPDDAPGAPTWHVDEDGDGYGTDGDEVQACDAPAGTVAAGGDCNDDDASVSPGAEEVWYDGIDQNCAGDDDFDADADGHATASSGGDDCDDTEAGISPDAEEVWYDGVDQDCAGDDDYDADGDGQASASWGGDDCDDADASVYLGADDVPYDGVISDCANSSDADADADGYDSATFGGDDCDDARSDVHPGAPENWYDGVDQDCDGNDGDQDADGYALNYDCNDTDAAVNPGAIEADGNGVDDDCDGVVDLAGDADTACGGCASTGTQPLAYSVVLGLLCVLRRSPRSQRRAPKQA